ncbi:MFS transporter [Paenibacillus sp. NPDC056579]|uniref:MFS transporter n=1 Tax=Paenibacillus sp. NPDC056579 TaxID=3345871 RepID=UPI00367E20CE
MKHEDAARFKGNIGKLYAITFCNGWIFAYVIERLFAVERGLSIIEMQWIFIIFSVTSVLLEIPCGLLADKWKKKYVLSLGLAICTLEFAMSLMAYSFPVFALTYVVTAVGCSLKSGTMESIWYETLQGMGRSDKYEAYLGRWKLLKFALSGAAGVLGGYMADRYGLAFNYWMSMFGLPAAAIIALTLYEPERSIQDGGKITSGAECSSRQNVQQLWKQCRYVLAGPLRPLLPVMLFGGIIGAVLYGQLHEISSLSFPQLGFQVSQFGYISLATMIVCALSGLAAAKLKERYSYPAIFVGLMASSIALLFLYSGAAHKWQIAYLIVCIFLMETVSPLTTGYIQRRADDRYRVTISSIDSVVTHALTAATGLLFGWSADRFGLFAGFGSMAWLLLASGSVLALHYLVQAMREASSR